MRNAVAQTRMVHPPARTRNAPPKSRQGTACRRQTGGRASAPIDSYLCLYEVGELAPDLGRRMLSSAHASPWSIPTVRWETRHDQTAESRRGQGMLPAKR